MTLPRVLRAYLKFVWAVVVAALIATQFATGGGGGGGGGNAQGGIGANIYWNGQGGWSPNYTYATVQASEMPYSRLCSASTAFSPNFPPAATALSNGGIEPNAAYIVTSYLFARNVCGDTGVTPAGWGQQQADWWVYLMKSGYSGPVGFMFADLETFDGTGTYCPKDYSGWMCDTGPNNVAVISAFENELSALGYLRGIYTNATIWQEIPGLKDANPNLGTTLVWMADYDGVQSDIQTEENFFTQKNYTIFAWQYATDICEVKYSAAQGIANAVSPAIPRFDKWTNSTPNQVCS